MSWVMAVSYKCKVNLNKVDLKGGEKIIFYPETPKLVGEKYSQDLLGWKGCSWFFFHLFCGLGMFFVKTSTALFYWSLYPFLSLPYLTILRSFWGLCQLTGAPGKHGPITMRLGRGACTEKTSGQQLWVPGHVEWLSSLSNLPELPFSEAPQKVDKNGAALGVRGGNPQVLPFCLPF